MPARLLSFAIALLALCPAGALAHPRLLAEQDARGGSDSPEVRMREEIASDLKRDLLRLRNEEPTYVSTVSFGIGGAASLGVGVGLLVQNMSVQTTNLIIAFFDFWPRLLCTLGATVLVVAGVALLIVAVIKFFVTRSQWVDHEIEVKKLEQRIERLSPDPSAQLRPSMPLFSLPF